MKEIKLTIDFSVSLHFFDVPVCVLSSCPDMFVQQDAHSRKCMAYGTPFLPCLFVLRMVVDILIQTCLHFFLLLIIVNLLLLG